MISSKSKTSHLDGNAIIAQLIKGEMSILDKVYDHYKPEYLKWAEKKYPGLNPEDFLDSWHDAIIAFYEQVAANKLKSIQYELKTYLFTIGYRILIRKHKKMQEIIDDEYIDTQMIIESMEYFKATEDLTEERKDLLLNAINELPPQSKQVLMLRFIEGKSLKDISQILNYGYLNVLSATISRSLKRLKENIKMNLEL